MRLRYPLLVVDDELANLQKLKRTFVRDFEVSEAQSGEEALRLLEKRSFAVIITDQRMPGISGVDLLARSLQSSPDAIRIILTGYTDVEGLMDAINQGQVHRYITKPWEPFSLLHTVIQDVEHLELKRENQLLAEQLRIAQEVQAKLFPQSFPRIASLDYTGLCRAAREVGGDYYDFLQLRPGQLWIVVADISGKGISAALLMANLQALLRSLAPLHGGALADLVCDVNRFLRGTTDGSKFATLFCGVYDSETRMLDYVNAGHCPPVIVRSNGDVGMELLQPTGTVVGLFEDARYEQDRVQLSPGDMLLVYTDGITEAFDSAFREFGESRLHALAADQAHLPIREFCDRILREVSLHAGETPQYDDLTLVVGRVQ